MPVPVADKILDVLKEGLGLWKTFIKTRQEAYNRQQDKKQVAAIEMAEKYIFQNDKLLEKLRDLKLDEDKVFTQDFKKLAYWRRKFFKFH